MTPDLVILGSLEPIVMLSLPEFTCIVLNLYSMKSTLFFPTLFCLKKIFPGESRKTIIAVSKITGEKTISPARENNISKVRIKNLFRNPRHQIIFYRLIKSMQKGL